MASLSYFESGPRQEGRDHYSRGGQGTVLSASGDRWFNSICSKAIRDSRWWLVSILKQKHGPDFIATSLSMAGGLKFKR